MVLAATTSAVLGASVTGNLLHVQGTTSTVRVESTGQLVASGGLLHIHGDIELTEVNGFASGALVIANPSTKDIMCDKLWFDVTRNHLTTTNQIKMDIYAGTGSINEIGSPSRGSNTGSTLIQNNWTTATGSYSLGTGSVLAPHGPLKLYGSDDTSNVNQINVVSITQSGSAQTGFVGTYHLDCRYLQ